MKTAGRFESLDQWRGWAMVLVLVNHGLKPTGLVEGLGRTGVNLFFVISGLLTAMSLLSIERRKKSIWTELARKRFWRLVPTLWAFLIVLGLLDFVLWPETTLNLWSTALFFVNYTGAHISHGHLWSVATEMHFYLARGAGPVVIIGILPGGPVPLWRRPFWSDTIDEARLDVNRQLAEALPPDAWVAPPSDLEPADFVDHLHFSPSGYRKVERALREAGFPPGEDGSR